MFFAQMYCFGSDLARAGVTGIRGCMGVVYNSGARLYSLHVPPNSAATNQLAADTFVGYIRTFENPLPKAGNLYIFLNGTNRSDALDEANYLRWLIQPTQTQVIRIMEGLGEGSGGLHAEFSPSVMVTSANRLMYKHVPEDEYVVPSEVYAESMGGDVGGQYRGSMQDTVRVPSDAHGLDTWIDVSAENSTIQHL